MHKRCLIWREPTEHRYEDRYGQYLAFFKEIAECDPYVQIEASDVPWSWVPLLLYLRCKVARPVFKFPSCYIARRALWTGQTATTGLVDCLTLDRSAVEMFCGARPELVDALYKIDMQWNVHEDRIFPYTREKEFVVATNGAFFRREVRDFITLLDGYKPSKRNVVLCPCAADKPYPAPLHTTIQARLPDDSFYVAVATGVLGIVPEDLWSYMPHYDSGLPNEWRLMRRARAYFRQHPHSRIVVYCDFYSLALADAFIATLPGRPEIDFVFPVQEYPDYVDLMADENLAKLEAVLKGD